MNNDIFKSSLGCSPLGNANEYPSEYSPSLLYPISRAAGRISIGVDTPLPFDGVDIWNAYELSWLDNKGKPCIAIAELYVPSSSQNIIESKSLKLYLNSLNQSSFDDVAAVVRRDTSKAAGGDVGVILTKLQRIGEFCGECLDDIDVVIDTYTVNPHFLKSGPNVASEVLFSHLLKTNCPKTGQPDWGSVLIKYSGRQIDREGLLKYIISYRNHNGFHEQCVEKIFVDIMQYCSPTNLTVYARYLRRGGLDINPFRSNYESPPCNMRLFRQ